MYVHSTIKNNLIFNESGFNKDSIFGGLLQGGKTGAIVDVIDELSFNDAEIELDKFNSTLQNTGMTVADYFDQYEAGTPLLREFVESTDESGRSAANYVKFVKQERAAQIANNAAVEQGTVAYKALGVAKKFAAGILNAGIMMAATWAIQKVVEAIDNYIHRYEIAIDKMNEAKDRIKSVNDSLSENTAYVNANMEAYLKLREGINSVNNENISLSDEEYKEFLDLNKEFANMFPELINGFDDQGTAILNLGTNADISRQKLAELLEQQQRNADYQVYQELGAMYGGVEANLAYLKEAQNEFEETKKRANDFTEAVEQLGKVDFDAMTIDFGDNLSVDAFSALYNGVGDFYNQLGKEGRSAMYQNSEGLISGVDDLIHYQYDEFTQTYSVFLTNLDKLDEDTKAALINSIKDNTSNMVSEYGDIVGNASSEMLDKQNSYNAAWLDYIRALAQGMRSQASFSALDPAVQDFAYNFVSSIDSSILDQMENGQEFDYTYVRDNILSRLKDIPPEKALKFSELLSGEVDYDQFIQIYNDLVEFFRQNGIDVPLNFIYDQSLNGRFSKSISDISMSGRSAGSVSQENEERKLTEYTTQNVATDEQREQWIEYTRGAKDAAEAIQLYEEGVRGAAEATEELNGKLSMSEDELSNALSKIGVSTDTFNQYKEDLQAIYPELARDEEAAKRYALSNQQIAAATNDLSSNLEGYLDTINAVTDTENDANRASVEYMNALRSVADDLSNLFGREFTLDEAETFIRNTENANQLKAAIEGDTSAFNALQQRLAQPVIAQITADAEINIDDFNAQYSAFCDWLNGLAPGTILTNADLNANPFFQTLQEMYQQGKLTAQQISDLFGALGYDVDFDWEDISPQYVGGGLTTADAQVEKFAQKAVESAKIRMPTNIHYIQKNQTPTAKAPSGGGSKSGGSGGGGGGGGSKASDPMEKTADSMEESIDDAANEITNAALDAINKISERWEQTIYMMQDQINDVQFAIDKKINEKDIAALSGKRVKGMWKDVIGNQKYLIDSYNQLAGGYQMQAAEMQAELEKQIAAGAIAANSPEAQNVTRQIMDLQNNAQNAILDAQQAQIKLLEMRQERRSNVIKALEGIINKFKNTVDRWAKVADKAWRFTSKNFAINQEIKANDNQLTRQKQLRSRYGIEARKTADTIGMDLARKIQQGTWNPKNIKDGYVLEQALKYEELRDKIQECADAISDLYDAQRELIQQKVDAIISQYETFASYLESFAARIDAAIGLKNAKGQRTSLADIVQQYGAKSDITSNADQELNDLKANKDDIIKEHHDITQAEIEDSKNAYKDTKKYEKLQEKKEKLEKKKEKGKLGKKGKKQLESFDSQLATIEQDYVRGGSVSARQLGKAQKIVDKYGDKDYNKLSKKQKKLLDNARKYLQIAEEERAAEEERLKILQEDDEKFENDYEQKITDAETARDNGEAKQFELLKEIAEYQLNELKAIQDNLETMLSNFKNIIDIIKDYDMGYLADLGVLDYLGINPNSSKTGVLSGLYGEARGNAKESINNRMATGNVYQQLIDAALTGDFSSVREYAEKHAPELLEIVDAAIKQLEENGYIDSTWIDEWRKGLADVNSGLKSDIATLQELKDEARENVLFAATTKAINQLDRLKKVLSSMQSILPSDWDVDVNGLTPIGNAHVNEYKEEWKIAQDEASKWANRLKEIDAAQANPEAYGYKSEEDWLNARTEAVQNYYTAIQNGESAAQKIYELGRKAREAELNQLKRLVEARKQALAVKKSYYEYDRKHKDAQKAVDELTAQIEALNGVSDAASKAKMKQLQSDLEDAQQSLSDLEMDHQYELSTQALDDLVTKAEEAIDTSLMTFKESVQFFSETVDEAVNASKNVSSQWVNDSTIQFFADGVSKGLTSAVENLSKENLLKNPDYTSLTGATYTPLSQEEFVSTITTSTVSPELFNEQIGKITSNIDTIGKFLENKMQPDVAKLAQNLDIVADIDLNYDNLIHIEGNTDAVTYQRMMSEMDGLAHSITSRILSSLGKAGIKRKYK